jgi:hypothetical protein
MDSASSAKATYVGVSSVIERFGPSYIASHGAQMPFVQLDALGFMEHCRTAAAGSAVLLCRECGVFKHHYHSCRHRACPKCCNQDNDVWLAALAPLRRKAAVEISVTSCITTLSSTTSASRRS